MPMARAVRSVSAALSPPRENTTVSPAPAFSFSASASSTANSSYGFGTNLSPASSMLLPSAPITIFDVVSGTRLRHTAIFKTGSAEKVPDGSGKLAANLVAPYPRRQRWSRPERANALRLNRFRAATAYRAPLPAPRRSTPDRGTRRRSAPARGVQFSSNATLVGSVISASGPASTSRAERRT